MTKDMIPAALLKKVTNANLNGHGYVIPDSLNNIWRKEAQIGLENGTFTFVKSRSKTNGYHVVGLEIPKAEKVVAKKKAPRKQKVVNPENVIEVPAETQETPAPKPKRIRKKKSTVVSEVAEGNASSTQEDVVPQQEAA